MSSTEKEAPRIAALDAATAVLEGSLGVIEGCRRLRELGDDLVPDSRDDTDFVIFIAVDSETDALPTGTARELWDPAALAREDREIQRAEAMYRESVMSACQRVIKRFGKARF